MELPMPIGDATRLTPSGPVRKGPHAILGSPKTEDETMTGFFVDAYEVIGFNHEGMKIAVSAYRSCGGGIDRLRELHGMAMVRAKRTGDDWFLMSELLRLHDRKGHLTAVWR